MDSDFFEDDDSDSKPAASWSSLLDQIDDLVAEAATTADLVEKRRLLERALKLACKFITRLDRRLKRFIRQALKDAGLEAEGLSLPLADVAAAHPELEVFRDRETLEDFLNSTADLLEQQGYLNRKRLDELKGEVSGRFDQMLSQQLSLEEFTNKFEMLHRLICRPPEGPDGGGDPGGSGPTETPGQRASRIIQTLGALATIGGLIAALMFDSPDKPVPEQPTKPPVELPHELRLLALLLLAALVDWLDAQGMIPDAPPEIADDPVEDLVRERTMTAGA